MPRRPCDSREEDRFIPTTSQILPDAIVELVLRDQCDGPELLLWTQGELVIAPHVEHDGKIYRVPFLHPSIVKATRLASGISDYSNTRHLIELIAELFQRYIGLLADSAQLLTFWVLSSWLADCVLSPLCLVVSGFDMGLAVRLLLLLKCLVRRPLLLTEIARAGFCSVVTQLRATALINEPHLSHRIRDFWRTSNYAGLVVPGGGGGVCDVSGPKALFIETELVSDPWSTTALHVALPLSHGALPPFDKRTQNVIANEFLGKLLLYRLRSVPRVQDSLLSMDPLCPTGVSTLQACVPDPPEFAQSILPLLEAQHEDTMARRRLDPAQAIIEVIWGPVHEKTDLNPGKIADLMNALLRCRGENREFSAEEVGWKLRHLGFYRHREGSGMVLRVCRNTSQQMHLLARQFGLVLPSFADCLDCAGREAVSG